MSPAFLCGHTNRSGLGVCYSVACPRIRLFAGFDKTSGSEVAVSNGWRYILRFLGTMAADDLCTGPLPCQHRNSLNLICQVLAMGIVAVFCAGLVKLWWNTRLMKKQEILDEEKKARLEEMRKTGIPLNRPNEIPFGVRAIQSGVEVDGIWISRPVSPNEAPRTKMAPSVTVIDLDPDKAVEYSGDSKRASHMTASSENAPQQHSLPNGSITQRLNDVESLDDNQQTTPPVSQFASQPRRHARRSRGVLNEDTLRRLEGQSPRVSTQNTYAPTSAPHNGRQPSQRSSVSSSGESMDSQPRSNKSISARSYSSSRSSKLYMARNVNESRGGYNPDAMIHAWQEEQRDPFGTPKEGTPARTPTGFSAFSNGEYRASPTQRHLLVPEPTFGPGDLHINRATRKVNNGFEVLPAGTFGVLHEFEGNVAVNGLDSGGLDQEGRPNRSLNKLRKKSNGQLQGDGVGLEYTS